MPDAVLIFTFSPIQSFISEARRTADLYAGSQILVKLAGAAGAALSKCGKLVYPTRLEGDVPNKIVACLPWDKVETAAGSAQQALEAEWRRIADEAHRKLQSEDPRPDGVWKAIWERQMARQWECYWAAAALDREGDQASYARAYRQASQALDAAKRTRAFAQSQEAGLKDSLSGCREALHTEQLKAKEYWKAIAQQVLSSQLRRDGRERLDAIGVVKRFCQLGQESFPSTSSVASRDFLSLAEGSALPALRAHRRAVETLLGKLLFRVQSYEEWPYDGDLLYVESLTPERLKDEFGLDQPDAQRLEVARKTLKDLYREVGRQPATYYAILLLDGDNMGKQVDSCLAQADPQSAHQALSEQISRFSALVPDIVDKYTGTLVYNGGDDVLALVPLSQAFDLGRALAADFTNCVNGGSASAGIAVVHHQYPLGAALRAAREAERGAKEVNGKNAVCIRVLKRSGEITQMRSPWLAVGNTLTEMISLFKADGLGAKEAALASGFAYDVLNAAYALGEADEKLAAELKRLVKRHRNPRHPAPPDPEQWAKRLTEWAGQLPGGAEELGRWLVFARFVAQGGVE